MTRAVVTVKAKPSPVYQTQLPEDMVSGMDKITEMEASWER